MTTAHADSVKPSIGRIERLLNSNFFPVYRPGEDPGAYRDKVEKHAEALHRTGATHVLINRAPLSILQVMDPENSYLRFTTYGHTFDKYVHSTWNEGIYHPTILEQNREALLDQAAMAAKFGFRCWVRCVEMTMMPESFYLRHPSLRGPRVDNPACSTSPRYAMCPMLAETEDHYRQLTRKFLALCPLIDEMHIFTCDSGGGFSYAAHLYSGANGPFHSRHIPPGKQAQHFCRYVLDAGQKVNAGFRVVMTSGLTPKEKIDFLDGAPPGVASSIYGAFAWGGGLEDRWQNMAIGPDIHKPEVRAKAREWADADMGARAAAITSRGGIAYASYNPDYYSGPSDAPRPFETHEVLMKFLGMGVNNIVGGPWDKLHHANSGIFVQVLKDGPSDTPRAVRKLAAAWVGESRADRLVEAWKLAELADREWPMPASGGHAFWCQPLTIRGPMLPNRSLAKPEELEFFMTTQLRDEEKMASHQGGVWRILHYRDPIKRYVIGQLESYVLPKLDESIRIVEDLLNDPALSPTQRGCLEVQRDEIGIFRCYMARVRNWFQASYHIAEGSTPYEGLPSLAQIIQQELDNSQAEHECQGHTGPLQSPRQAVMRRHQYDPPERVDLRKFPYHEYLGLNHWPGAHLANQH